MQKQRPLFYLGIMSGTSVDAIDLALVKINDNACEFIAGDEAEFTANIKHKIISLCTTQHTSLSDLGQLTSALSHEYASAVRQFLKQQKLEPSDIIAIGCHGQTVCHEPNSQSPFSMQLMNSAIVAAHTGITTVSDFRSMDLALGGQGAPLVPLFHQQILKDKLTENEANNKATVVLNIGGISNISILGSHNISGFDTGPGNVLLDSWIQRSQGKHYDENGQLARSGQIQQTLLTSLLNEPYFKLAPPKSTGRELFNLAWLDNKLAQFSPKFSDQDIMASLVAFTCISIARALPKDKKGDLLVCGGGAKNSFILENLAQVLPNWQVSTTSQQGIDSDYMEAMAFAWLAYRCLSRQSGNLSSVTGASRDEICGQICQISQHEWNKQ